MKKFKKENRISYAELGKLSCVLFFEIKKELNCLLTHSMDKYEFIQEILTQKYRSNLKRGRS